MVLKQDEVELRKIASTPSSHLDTMLKHYALDEHRGTHDLKQLAEEFLGAKPYSYKEVAANGTLEALYHYNALDCDNTYQLEDFFESQLDRPMLRSLYENLLLPAGEFLQDVEDYGLLVDTDELASIDAELAITELEAADKCKAIAAEWWGDTPFNPSSVPDVTYLIYHQLKLSAPTRRTPQNTEKKTLLLLPPHPFIDALLDYRQIKKLRSTYVKGLPKHINPRTGRIHPSYLLHGTVNGRLSCKDPNMQNIPRVGPIKRAFIAAPGYCFVDIDYSQNELRTLAHLSNDPDLIQVYKDGRDLHTEVSIALFQDFLARYQSEDDTTYKHANEQRTMSKTINFGIMYGRGARAIADVFHISIEEATRLVEGWFLRFPAAHAYIQRCRLAPLRGEILITPLGRRRRFYMVTRDTLNTEQNEACNFPISSTASDMLLLASMRAHKALKAVDAHIVNLVHDNAVIECPDNPATIRYVADTMLEMMRDTPNAVIHARVPFDAEAKAGRRWGKTIPLAAYLEQRQLELVA